MNTFYIDDEHYLSFFLLFCGRSFLLEDRCRFLSNFSLATAEVELPGEYLVPKVCDVVELVKGYCNS